MRVACVLVVFAQGCCRCVAAVVLWLEMEDVGMQWSCQCSECWCDVLQRWYDQGKGILNFSLFFFTVVCGSLYLILSRAERNTLSYVSMNRERALHSFALTQIHVLQLKTTVLLLELWCRNHSATTKMRLLQLLDNMVMAGVVVWLLSVYVPVCLLYDILLG